MRNNLDKRAAGMSGSQNEAEKAVRELKDAGYDIKNISIVAKDVE